MSIIKPSLPKRKKRNPTAKERELKAAWDAIVKSHQRPLEKGARANGIRRPKPDAEVGLTIEVVHAQPSPPTQEAFAKMRGSTAPRSSNQYTGTAMLGTAAMHKSNEVPVFSKEDAISISKMRRG